MRRPTPWRGAVRRRSALASALLILMLVVAAAIVLSPGARNAVADRLGLRGVVIVLQTPTPVQAPAMATPTPSPAPTMEPTTSPYVSTPPPGASLELGDQVTLAEAQAKVPFAIELPSVAELGQPDEVWLATGTADIVTLIYYPRPGIPETGTPGIGLLLSEFQGSLIGQPMVKGATPEQVTPVTVSGGVGFWINGVHFATLYNANVGNGRSITVLARLAGNTLVWEHGSLTLRLESALSETEALQVAASLR